MTIKDTKAIQVRSVVDFMLPLGFYPVHKAGIVYFEKDLDAYETSNTPYISVNTAIRLHNEGFPITARSWISLRGKELLAAYMDSLPIKITPVQLKQAKASKIVDTAKLQFSHKKGIICQSHWIKWASIEAEMTYGHILEE